MSSPSLLSLPRREEIAEDFIKALKNNDLGKVKYYIEEAKFVNPMMASHPVVEQPEKSIGNALVVLARETTKMCFAKDAERDSRAELTEYLISVGYDVNGKDPRSCDRSVIHHACRNRRADILRVLLAHGCDVHARDRANECCIHHLYPETDRDCWETVILHDPSILHYLDSDGKSLYWMFIERSYIYWQRFFKTMVELFPTTSSASSPTMTEVLNSAGTKDDARLTPFLLACTRGFYPFVKILLEEIPPEKNAFIDIYATHPKTGENALHIVCQRDTKKDLIIDLIYLLVEKGGPRMLLAKDNKGQTPVYKAIDVSDLANVKRLVALGGADAVWNAPRDKNGFSPLEYARDLVSAGDKNAQSIVDFFTIPNNTFTSPTPSAAATASSLLQKTSLVKGIFTFADFLANPSSSDNLNALLEVGKHRHDRKPPILDKELVAAEAARIQQEYDAVERAAAEAEEAEYQKFVESDPAKARASQEEKFRSALESLDYITVKFLIEKGRVDVNVPPTIDNKDRLNALQIILRDTYNTSSKFSKANRIAKYLITEAKINLFHRGKPSIPCFHYIFRNFGVWGGGHFWRELFDIVFLSGDMYVTDEDLLHTGRTFSYSFGTWSVLNTAVRRGKEAEYAIPKLLARLPQLAAIGSELPILKAASDCNIPVCRMLLDTKLFDINQTQPTNNNNSVWGTKCNVPPAFHQCAMSDSRNVLETMQFLLDRGADLFACGPDPLDTALHSRTKQRPSWNIDYDVIKFLLEKGRLAMLLRRNKKFNTALEAAFLEAGNIDAFQSLICIGGGAAYFTKELRRLLLALQPRHEDLSHPDDRIGFSKIKKFLTDGDLPEEEDEDVIVKNIVSVCCSRKYGRNFRGLKLYEPIITSQEWEAFRKWQTDVPKVFEDERSERNQITTLEGGIERLELQETISRFNIVVKEENLQFVSSIRLKFAIALLSEKETNDRSQLIEENINNNLDLQESISRFNIFANEENREFAKIIKLETTEKKSINNEAARKHRLKVLKLSALSFVFGYAACWGYQRFVSSDDASTSNRVKHFVVASLLFCGTYKILN